MSIPRSPPTLETINSHLERFQVGHGTTSPGFTTASL
ncbi:hypothetical protein NP493_582g02019 [Ridgeia piscesae]|uniref:Uncharacterized protein n=1 Tax=Ridgeia piscesae TaxID=27915 RepID=A0AAD9NP90_RIDPI|nr:hypothetical protein NP493_582g02019 [Ridgeia piscesae]